MTMGVAGARNSAWVCADGSFQREHADIVIVGEPQVRAIALQRRVRGIGSQARVVTQTDAVGLLRRVVEAASGAT